MNWPLILATWLLAYLIGSFPAGYLAGRLLKGIDIREQGSGSTGATNVLRTLGKGPAIAVLLIDVLKGLVAILMARALLGDNGSWAIVGAGLAAIVGHSWPIWLGFRGGKSVAVSIGIVFGLQWQVGLTLFAIWGLCFGATRIVSFASIVAALAAPIGFYLWGTSLPFILFGLAGGLSVVFRHRSNIARLLKGTEPKIGSSSPAR
ncbi:glycerol-3-phosphate 1-O-acyltransferase PlsY [Gloeobacter kilaueensis]|uniref:Glycerol-3-phosphate acyltransferase n=1 Tax=Gloeobacter kilaueensis (strain ATCC BAA-2537 / CCAP 1431/1 / ULC 316 / JS1) TaxID=1183438 RepID=U5QIL8_GLOK1|nr:glycerol-3-phosphate 1-O-acyltransferase PlsY [Gloeobacter kilaueensis]AGY57454.1 glycerol-3-phosphate acyltransferase PlsY [Gloeobacter kilaueensis JS1]